MGRQEAQVPHEAEVRDGSPDGDDQDRHQAHPHCALPWRQPEAPRPAPGHWQLQLGSEVCTRKTRILNASNNELRTKTLVKGAIVQVDATPMRQWYEAHYGVTVGRKAKKVKEGEEAAAAPVKKSKSVEAKIAKRQETRQLDPNLNSQFDTGRLLAMISSRPGQCGRCDGYVLEGKSSSSTCGRWLGRRSRYLRLVLDSST